MNDNEDNHCTSYHKYFLLESSIRALRSDFHLTFLPFQHINHPRQMSESTPLYTNETTMVRLKYNGHITHKHRMYLHTLPCSEEYRKFMSTKYNLSEVWEQIDWYNFFEAMKRYHNRGITVSKFLHGWLSTGANALRYGKFKQKQCPFCDKIETTAHLYQCQEATQKETINNELETLWKKAEEFIDPTLVQNLRHHTDYWRAQNHHDNLPAPHENIFASQHTIGWTHLLQGRLSIKFLNNEISRITTNVTEKMYASANRRIQTFMKLLWDCGLNLWQQRNKRAHHPKDDTTPINTKELHSQVASLYTKKRKLHPDIQARMYPITQQEMMTKKNEYIRLWVEQMTPMLTSALTRTTTYERQIKDYFSSKARPPGQDSTISHHPT